MTPPSARAAHTLSRLLPLVLVSALVVIVQPAGTSLANPPASHADHKLIESGWDLQTARWLVKELGSHQDLPFDGMVFSPTSSRLLLFEPKPWSAGALQLRRLARIQWGRYTDNFILVWAMGPTEMDWTDDARWDVVVDKARGLSRAVAASRAEGIIFDPETYWPDLHPWAYVDARYQGMSFTEVETLVRARGAEFMTALASRAPDVEVLSYLSISYAAGLAGMDRSRLAGTEFALLPAFTEGMLSSGQGTVIDGDELAYYLDETTEYPARRDLFDRSKRFSAPYLPADADFQLGEAVWMDLTMGLNRHARGYPASFSQAWFEHNIYQSLLATDEYVWIYSEGVDWWRGRIPPGGREAVVAARSKFHAGQPLGFDMVSAGATGVLPARLVSDPPVLAEWTDPAAAELTAVSISVSGATRVSFYAGSRLLGTDSTAPYEIDVASLDGVMHVIVARAFTSSGSHTSSNILMP